MLMLETAVQSIDHAGHLVLFGVSQELGGEKLNISGGLSQMNFLAVWSSLAVDRITEIVGECKVL
jgi:hypothetical protein